MPDGGNQRIIVTAVRVGEMEAFDLEVPTDLPAVELGQQIAKAMGWDQNCAYALEATPPGRQLSSDETLYEAGVWDGTWLMLSPEVIHGGRHDAQSPVSIVPQTISPPDARGQDGPSTRGGPVVGWRKLATGLPGGDVQQPIAPQSRGVTPFSWKRVDGE